VGREACETMTTVFVSRPPACTEGNEARDVFGRKLDSGDDEERPREAGAEHHLHVEKARGSLRSYSTKVLGPRVGFPLRRGTNGD
jgi:hypothetical protein